MTSCIYDLTRGGLRTRFTFDPADEYSMSWMPDGSEIIFNSSRKADQQLDLYQKASSGAGGERLLFDDPANNVYVTDISADGRFLLYNNNGNANSPTGNDISALRLGGQTPTSTPILQTTFNETTAHLSPNGRWLAYQSISWLG